MERGRAPREGAGLAALAVLAGAFAVIAACSPLELDLTEGEAGPPDSTAPDVTVPHDATVPDTGPGTDSAPAADGFSADADGGADGDGSVQPLPCSQTADCVDASKTPLCNQEGGVCVQCLSTTDCGGNTPHCVSNVCIACQTNADCNDGGTEGGMACNTFIPRCASTCTTGNNCTQSGQGGLYCNTSAGYCVECTDNTYCVGASTGTHCYLAAGVCGCQTDADCPSTMPTCGPASLKGNKFCQK